MLNLYHIYRGYRARKIYQSQPPEERAAHKRFQHATGNRCACEIDGTDQVVVDGLLISCTCATDEAAHD